MLIQKGCNPKGLDRSASQRGFSLVEAVIVLGLVSGTALVVMQLSTDALKVQTNLSASNDFNQVANLVASMAGNEVSCAAAMGIVNGVGPNLFFRRATSDGPIQADLPQVFTSGNTPLINLAMPSPAPTGAVAPTNCAPGTGVTVSVTPSPTGSSIPTPTASSIPCVPQTSFGNVAINKVWLELPSATGESISGSTHKLYRATLYMSGSKSARAGGQTISTKRPGGSGGIPINITLNPLANAGGALVAGTLTGCSAFRIGQGKVGDIKPCNVSPSPGVSPSTGEVSVWDGTQFTCKKILCPSNRHPVAFKADGSLDENYNVGDAVAGCGEGSIPIPWTPTAYEDTCDLPAHTTKMQYTCNKPASSLTPNPYYCTPIGMKGPFSESFPDIRPVENCIARTCDQVSSYQVTFANNIFTAGRVRNCTYNKNNKEYCPTAKTGTTDVSLGGGVFRRTCQEVVGDSHPARLNQTAAEPENTNYHKLDDCLPTQATGISSGMHLVSATDGTLVMGSDRAIVGDINGRLACKFFKSIAPSAPSPVCPSGWQTLGETYETQTCTPNVTVHGTSNYPCRTGGSSACDANAMCRQRIADKSVNIAAVTVQGGLFLGGGRPNSLPFVNTIYCDMESWSAGSSSCSFGYDCYPRYDPPDYGGKSDGTCDATLVGSLCY